MTNFDPAGNTAICTDAWDLGYTKAPLPKGAKTHGSGREATARLQRLVASAQQHVQQNNDLGSFSTGAEATQENIIDSDDGVDGDSAVHRTVDRTVVPGRVDEIGSLVKATLSGDVPTAMVTEEVLEVCRGDSVCQRFSNVGNLLAGTSILAVKDLLNELDASPGRAGVW